MAKNKLPKPNVIFALKGADKNEDILRGMICNPVYAGIGPFPEIMDEEQWVKAAVRMIEKEGSEQFLVNMLYMLRKSFEPYE